MLWLQAADTLYVDASRPYDSAVQRLSRSGPHRIEGIWTFRAEQITVSIERTSTSDGSSYHIILLDAPNRRLRPGTVIGSLTPGASTGIYEARLFSSMDGKGLLSRPKVYYAKLTDSDSRIEFRSPRHDYAINPAGLLPYALRRIIRRHNYSRDEQPQRGCVRIYPQPIVPEEPVYL